MDQYRDLVRTVLERGNYKPNRTGVDTVSSFSQSYTIDLQDGFPLLTTKQMDGFRWNSLIHELIWYFTGQHHIRDLQEHTSIWDAWADDEGRLPTAYGRFWRRYPIPDNTDQLPGEWWADNDADWISDAADRFDTTEDEIERALDRWINAEDDGTRTLDQIRYIIDTLNDENPMRGPNSRRLMVTPWNPANASVSHLPPCHAFWGVNVQNDRLNLHLTQRSGDIALGIPFNIAAYSLILHILARQTDFTVGAFSHTILDAHIYCGKDERGDFYAHNLSELQDRLRQADDRDGFRGVKQWIEETAPEQEEPYDHVPGLLEQLSREPLDRPSIDIADKPLDALEYDDITLTDYASHNGIRFAVAE
jgi:thymidylate synthase